MSSRTGIYAIVDLVAKTILGNQVMLHKHDAAAVRAFVDGISHESCKHPEDYELVCLGYFGDPAELDVGDEWVTPGYRSVLTGAQWKALQAAGQDPQLKVS